MFDVDAVDIAKPETAVTLRWYKMQNSSSGYESKDRRAGGDAMKKIKMSLGREA